MERKRLISMIIPAAIGVLFLFMISPYGLLPLFAINRDIATYDEISDSEVVKRTSDLPEVKVFVEHYPNATIYVERVDDFAVGYHVRECEVKHEQCIDDPSRLERYNELRVRLDDNGYPTSSVLWCVHDINGELKTYKFENNIITKDNIMQSLNRDVCIFW